ncbi:HAD-IIB family hydrolase [Paenibacillus glucanolyticus]|uniref:HAD-IIB family hydrolase n=1 Tax=Paenibacillus glucanolyticus TaxID=59843 RepID=UPI00096DB2C6|nr:HAD-IIB family hydrolase [Paenibacillus glucanolyticus]OMF81582.1 hypothetical protein BK142_03650 [Paenibacillus glucanolyticus]
MEDKQCCVFDLDGTLIDSEETIFPGAVELILFLESQNIDYFICTARPLKAIKWLSTTLPNPRGIFCFNGALYVDSKYENRVIFRCLGTNNVLSIVKYLLKGKSSIRLFTADDQILSLDGNIWPNDKHEYYQYDKKIEQKELDYILDYTRILKISATDVDNCLDYIYEKIGGDYNFNINKAGILEITSLSSNKGNVIKYIKEKMEYSVIYAVGDGEVDKPMLIEADVGITFIDSDISLKERCRFIAESPGEGGLNDILTYLQSKG